MTPDLGVWLPLTVGGGPVSCRKPPAARRACRAGSPPAAGAVPALARVPRALSSSGRFREDRLQSPPGPAQVCAGVYGSAVEPGQVAVGDPVELER